MNPAGAAAERRVRRHYRLRGYRVLAANVRAGGGELDVVLRRGGRLVFCEVKMRAGPGFGDPLEAVGPEKARRVRRAAEAFLAARPLLAGLEVSLEAAAVRGRRVERVPLDW
ncbi:MAG: YraN family protein [Thermoleophilia bacterium]|nr:YraN family protein [Thermoleophilia bacterium]